MTELVHLIVNFGAPTVLVAAVIYVVLRGEVQFRYPRQKSDRPKRN
jgi:hypothetical protein